MNEAPAGRPAGAFSCCLRRSRSTWMSPQSRRSWTAVPGAQSGGINASHWVGMMSHATSQDRITALGRDDSGGQSIAAAFRDHSAAVRGNALRLTRDPEAAADVTQEAFLRLVLEAQAGRFPDNVGGWLYRTSANLIVSRARRAAVARRLAPRLLRSEGPAEPDAIAVLQEQHHELRTALATLSGVDRVVLLMAAHGATGEEIACHLGRTQGATRTLLCRARGRLRAATMEPGAIVRGGAWTPGATGAKMRPSAWSSPSPNRTSAGEY